MTQSMFVEKAAQEAAEAPVIEGEKQADDLLREARSRIYHWPPEFPGFRCTLKYQEGAETKIGTLSSHGSRKIHLTIPQLEDKRWLRYQIEELIAHREAPSVSRMASKSGCSWGDWDETYGRRIDFLGDKMSSFYRIKNAKLMQIGRSYKKQSFIINIDQHQECDGSFAARYYTAYYWSHEDESLKRVETYIDDYQAVEGVYLPCRRQVTEAVDGRLRCRTIRLENLERDEGK